MQYTITELKAIADVLNQTTSANVIMQAGIEALKVKTEAIILSFHTPADSHVGTKPSTEAV